MDKLITYRGLIKRLLTERAAVIDGQPVPGLETLRVFDEERDHYLLVTIGWVQRRRVRGTSLYLRLRNDKIWIEEDLTENGIACLLLKAGVPRDDIVLAFQPPEMRPLTEFAVA